MQGRERLYEVPPGGFTRARDELARALRDKGDAEGSKAVAAMRKPPVALWIVNQLGRDAPALVKALVEATARVRHAQAGRAQGDELRESMREQREALAALSGPIEQATHRAGSKPTLALQRRVQATVQAAAAAEPEALRAGTLDRELVPSGFESLLGEAPAPPPPRKRDDADDRRKAEEDRRRLERERREAAEQAHRLDAAAKDLEDAARRADEAAAAARTKAGEARRAADEVAARALDLRRKR